MILTAHQPLYLPWLGLFHKIYLAEKFCYFDIAQYQNKDFNNRNKIKTNTGELLLSVPVESKDHFSKKLYEIKIQDGSWKRKHLKSIRLAYQSTEYFEKLFPLLEAVYAKNHTFLNDLNFELLQLFLSELGIDRPIVKASDYEFKGQKSDLVLDMCVQLKADIYIFGSQGRDYADVKSFHDQKIDLYFQDYQHPQYSQKNGDFISHLSVIDLLFNEGPKSLEILLKNNLQHLKKDSLESRA